MLSFFLVTLQYVSLEVGQALSPVLRAADMLRALEALWEWLTQAASTSDFARRALGTAAGWQAMVFGAAEAIVFAPRAGGCRSKLEDIAELGLLIEEYRAGARLSVRQTMA